jgi:nucleoside-diphosphate-sugar epimerase
VTGRVVDDPRFTDPSDAPLVPSSDAGRRLDRLQQPVAVTGGTGFVGSHLVDTLCAAGLRPRVLVREPRAPRWIGAAPVEWVAGSLADRDALGRLVAGAGTVLHLAGVVRAGSAAGFDRGNRAGTANLVTAVLELAPAARLVHVSSLAAAGPSPDPAGVGPEVTPRPVSHYGRSKLAAEAEVRRLPAGRWWTILRPPAIYGPRDTDVLEFFRMASLGWMAIPAGERWITVAWVGDVVRAVLAAAVSAEAGRTHHLGEPAPYRLDELLRAIAEVGGVRARLVRVPEVVLRSAAAAGSALQRLGLERVALTRDKAREILASHWTARTADSLEALGLEETTSFADGAAATWRWYRARGWLR